jgi:hypothetical protein
MTDLHLIHALFNKFKRTVNKIGNLNFKNLLIIIHISIYIYKNNQIYQKNTKIKLYYNNF